MKKQIADGEREAEEQIIEMGCFFLKNKMNYFKRQQAQMSRK